MTKDVDQIDDFGALMGAFGKHADLGRRGRSERRAGLNTTDKRRKSPEQLRDAQIATRIRRSVYTLVRKLCEQEGWSHADMIERLVEDACKKRGIQ